MTKQNVELSNLQGTVGNVIKKHLKEINNAYSKNINMVNFMQNLFIEENITSNPYVVEVINELKRKNKDSQLQYLYNVMLAGDNLRAF